SYGGVVALMVALRGRVKPRALALFEPVAVPVLAAVGEAEAFVAAQALFERYCAAFEAGDREAVRVMVDYWFGEGAFGRMPASMRAFLVAHTGPKVRDVRATFRDPYSTDALHALAMPVLGVYGARSPEVMGKIVEAIASHAPRGIIKKLEEADHAMTTTHAEAVAALIAKLADERA
ncbi:MAG: alpha/beta fold hydrolase, partial [Candidatus Rokuibacteriota bacterium]